MLSGNWFDGTDWSVNIVRNDSTASIMAVPEPATVLLFGLGCLVLRKEGVMII